MKHLLPLKQVFTRRGDTVKVRPVLCGNFEDTDQMPQAMLSMSQTDVTGIRMIVSQSIINGWELDSGDVGGAFLYAPLPSASTRPDDENLDVPSEKKTLVLFCSAKFAQINLALLV